jgi:4-hydroxy-tetrahydrodipicolinate synthase
MPNFAGTYTALVTPFRTDESLDLPAFEALVEAQIQGGITGLVPCGTTGESPTLTESEQLELIRRTVQCANKRAQVIAGTGSNSTKHAVHLSRAAEEAGADAVMVVVPYYNKPSQDGLFAHYVTIAKSVKCPVILYNIPGRSGIDLTADTLLRIHEAAPNVMATKEATGNVLRAQEIVRRSQGRIQVLSGDDALTLPMMSVGALGVISVSSNVLPREVSEVVRLALAGKWNEARALHLNLLPVHDVMFVESNPAPCKAVLAHRGMLQNVLRAPMAKATESAQAKVLAALAAYSGTAKS